MPTVRMVTFPGPYFFFVQILLWFFQSSGDKTSVPPARTLASAATRRALTTIGGDQAGRFLTEADHEDIEPQQTEKDGARRQPSAAYRISRSGGRPERSAEAPRRWPRPVLRRPLDADDKSTSGRRRPDIQADVGTPRNGYPDEERLRSRRLVATAAGECPRRTWAAKD